MEERKSDRVFRFTDIHYQARVAARKSQEYMAFELGVAKKTIQNWEKGVSSPSFFQSLEWFRVLNINPLPYYLKFIYPEAFDVKGRFDSDEKIEDAFNALVKNISVKEKRALLYLYYGKHGSSPYSVLQLLLAHLHTPIESRLYNAQLVANVYKLKEALGETICTENTMPDMTDLNAALARAEESILKHDDHYFVYDEENANDRHSEVV